MLQLCTFGGPRIINQGIPLGPAARQPRCLALLAILAEAGERPVSRDKVLAYLWSEIDQEKAAHRLAQLVYSLRRDLATDAVQTSKTNLRLDPESISTDLTAFAAAARAGEAERAASLYSGSFLDGFFLRDAPEFERWAEDHEHLRRPDRRQPTASGERGDVHRRGSDRHHQRQQGLRSVQECLDLSVN